MAGSLRAATPSSTVRQRSGDFTKTAANKALVRQFIEETHVKGKLDGLERYFDGGRFIEHDPRLTDGVATLREALEGQTKPGYGGNLIKTIHKVLGEGNFVLVMSEGTYKSKPSGL